MSWVQQPAVQIAPTKYEKVFQPVNDEYQPFKLVEKRNQFLEQKLVPWLVKIMGIPAGKRVLEIGCGSGAALVPLGRLCLPSRLVGVDIDSSALKEAKSNLYQKKVEAELLQEDVRKLPFADGSFDVILDLGTFYHINRRVMGLREIARVLAPNGIFISETRLMQFFAHPFRSRTKRIPWRLAPQLKKKRLSLFWIARTKTA